MQIKHIYWQHLCGPAGMSHSDRGTHERPQLISLSDWAQPHLALAPRGRAHAFGPKQWAERHGGKMRVHIDRNGRGGVCLLFHCVARFPVCTTHTYIILLYRCEHHTLHSTCDRGGGGGVLFATTTPSFCIGCGAGKCGGGGRTIGR